MLFRDEIPMQFSRIARRSNRCPVLMLKSGVFLYYYYLFYAFD